jgi:Ca-activated chloride channel family protein
MKKQLISVFTLVSILLLSACGAPAPRETTASGAPAESAAPSAAAPAPYDQAPAAAQDGMSEGESYLVIDENLAQETSEESMLTFSLKVDTAAYTNVARYLESGNLPPRDAVRTEELINYFSYDGDMPFNGDDPFSIKAEVGPSPFQEDSHMAFIRVKSQEIDRSDLPSSNLTFLIDTSGSMNSYDKLPLLKEAFALLVETLGENDRVSIVTYAGSSAVVLDGATGAEKQQILSAINNLEAGGSTAGADGILTAYALAEKNFLEDGNNRVILATDGDFNVGPASTDALAELVGEQRGNGVYLSILGFGTGNIRDDIMETLSKEGNGNYAYINDLAGAKKVLVEELAANLFTVADDVKAQIEFNPENVKSYRLVGYENRMLANEDFEDNSKDAGEIGAGTDVVMMFELELYGTSPEGGRKYAAPESENSAPDFANELFEVRLRYKDPGENESKLMAQPVFFADIEERGSTDFRFASAVAAFGHLLRDSDYAGDVTLRDVQAMAEDGMEADAAGYRSDFLRLLDQYERIR